MWIILDSNKNKHTRSESILNYYSAHNNEKSLKNRENIKMFQ